MLAEVWTPPSAATQFTQTATVTQAGATSTAEVTLLSTGVGTKTLAANQLAAGRTLSVVIRGILRYHADSTTIRLKAGATTLVSMVDATPTALVADTPFILSFLLTCRTAGASGTVIGNGLLCAVVAAGTTASGFGSTGTSTVVVDTTATQALDVTVQFGVSNSGNWLTVTSASITVQN